MSNLTLYNSSAGSGKTYTLVKEYLKKALNDEQIGANYYKHILAVTFTNKAATEMKERVIKALKEISSKQPLNGTTAFLLTDLLKPKTEGGLGVAKSTIENKCHVVLRSILHNYNDLAISTIDKFTHKIIRTFANDLHLPLNFEINLDEKEILSKAIDLLIAQAGKNSELTKLLIAFSIEKADDEKSWEIEEDIKKFAFNLLKEHNEFYLNQLNHLSINDFNSIRNELKANIKTIENNVSDLAKNALEEIDALGIEHSSFLSGYLPKYYLRLQKDVLAEPSATILKLVNEEIDWYSKKTPEPQKQLIDSNKSNLINRFNKIKNYIDSNISDYILNKLTFQNSYTLAVLNEIAKIIQEVKIENNELNFSDFNKKIADLIANEPTPFIYERLGEKYHHYFIDEFQDTSITQWQNLLPLIDNALANNHFNMLVGDAKQSIYRFRGGEVEQIINIPNIITNETNQKNENFTLIEQALHRNFKLENLSNNYRSKAEIVQFNNVFFQFIAKILPEKYINLYNNLNQGYKEDNVGGSIAISFVENQKKENYITDTLLEVKNTITQLLNDGYNLKDIAILTKEKKHGVLIAAHLIESGINVISSESLLLKNAKEVQFLIHLFNYQLQPNNKETELFIIQFLIEKKALNTELLTIFTNNKKNTLLHFLELNNLLLNSSFINKLSLYEITEYFINHFELDNNINIYLQFFLEKVYEYSSKKGNSIANFLEWWNQKSANFSITIPDGIDAVKVMTVHKSKGLEFPVVIYPFADTTITKPNSFIDYFWTTHINIKNLPTALIPLKKELEKTIHSADYKENLSKLTLDLVNLMYVALTRPEDRLYIISSIKKDSKGNILKNSIGAVNDYLYEFCQADFLTKNTDTLYTYGNFCSKTIEKENEQKQQVLTETFSMMTHNSWREKIKISYQAPKVWNINLPETIGEYGTLIHSVLAELTAINELETVLTKSLNKGILNENSKDELKKQLEIILNNPLILPLFTDFDSIKNEQAILLTSGENYKPDRVVFKGETIYIIDYKTGEPSKKHSEQVENYKAIISSMYPTKKIIGYLLYLNNNQIIEI